MDLASKLQVIDLRSTFLTGRANLLRPHGVILPVTSNTSVKTTRCRRKSLRISSKLQAVAVETAETDVKQDDIESLFSSDSTEEFDYSRRGSKNSGSGASSISSGVKLENISKSYKGVTVLKDVSWEVKKGEKVGLVGVNGAGKTTQLRIISGLEEPDSGNVIKAKSNMKIAFLSQEFEVESTRTVKEEFMSAFKEEMEVAERLEKVQKAIEKSVDDLELMGRLLDEFDLLQRRAQAVDLDAVDVKINKMMPELGFAPEDADRLVASFSGGWQMRMSLGKILLQV